MQTGEQRGGAWLLRGWKGWTWSSGEALNWGLASVIFHDTREERSYARNFNGVVVRGGVCAALAHFSSRLQLPGPGTQVWKILMMVERIWVRKKEEESPLMAFAREWHWGTEASRSGAGSEGWWKMWWSQWMRSGWSQRRRALNQNLGSSMGKGTFRGSH